MIAPHFHLTQVAWESRNFLSFAALLLLILDTLAMCEKEYRLIWRSPGISILVKFSYLFARYYGLVMMSVHYFLVQTLLANAPVSTMQCKAWYTYLFLSSLSLKVALDAILLLQVSALYHKVLKGSWKRCLLAVPILVNLAAVGFMISRSMLVDGAFTPLCSYRRPPVGTALFGSLILMIQASVWGVMYAKRNMGRRRTKLLKLVVREGTLTFVLLFGLIAAITPLVSISRTSNPFIVFVWPATLMSIVTCRLVIELRSLNDASRVAEAGTDPSFPSVELDTLHSTMNILPDFGVWDVRGH